MQYALKLLNLQRAHDLYDGVLLANYCNIGTIVMKNFSY